MANESEFQKQLAAAKQQALRVRSHAQGLATTPTFTQRQLRVGQRGYLSPRQRGALTKKYRPHFLKRRREALAYASQLEGNVAQAEKAWADYLAWKASPQTRRGRRQSFRPVEYTHGTFSVIASTSKGDYETAPLLGNGKTVPGWSVGYSEQTGPLIFNPTITEMLTKARDLKKKKKGRGRSKAWSPALRGILRRAAALKRKQRRGRRKKGVSRTRRLRRKRNK